jgi:large subunit ribosomal protein L1
MSFENDKLADNARDFIKAVIKAKPVALKGKYVLSVYLSSTMSPSVKLGAQQFES